MTSKVRNAARRRRLAAYSKGVRESITFLHTRAAAMRDEHARAVLNSAAHELGLALATHVAMEKDKHE